MRAVWSFWSRPLLHRAGPWCKPLHHLLAWGVSLRAASRHYPETALITDRAGKGLLIDQLGLPFVHVSTELEQLRDADPNWWALGKILAYGLQDQAFVHLDADVFLWKRLPLQIEQARMFSQSPEYIDPNHHVYRPREIECAFARFGLSLPPEWEWTRSKSAHLMAENCGILGGNDVTFLRYASKTTMDLLLRPEHAAAWANVCDKHAHTCLIEQWFFASACARFHRFHPASPHRGVSVRRLFPSDQIDPAHVATMGYTHLMGGTKSFPEVGRRLEERTRREDPVYYRRCLEVSQRPQLNLAGGEPKR